MIPYQDLKKKKQETKVTLSILFGVYNWAGIKLILLSAKMSAKLIVIT